MNDLNSQEQLSFPKNMACIIPRGEDKEATRVLGVIEHTNTDSVKGIPRRTSTWLNGSSSHIKNADSKARVSLDNKSSMHFSFDFECIMKMDKYMLKGLASTFGVAMQQPEKI